MKFEDRLYEIVNRYHLLSKYLSDIKIIGTKQYYLFAKEQSDLKYIFELAKQFFHYKELLIETENLIVDSSIEKELCELAKSEKLEYQKTIDELNQKIKHKLITGDKDDEKGAIIEIRAGAGGDEAALFSAVLFNMYQKYINRKMWKIEIVSINTTGLDGIREIIACINGKNVYKHIKYESGVHRVQRIPKTESNGRVHTSTVTIAILPEAKEIDVKIDEKDIRIDTFRGSGAGGQHVNTTDSAIRITHIPTGITVVQAEKSQHQNKSRAMKILYARVYKLECKKKNTERSITRKTQVGSGNRSEKIRTYNYPQNRITDHRINYTSHNLNSFINEGQIDDLIEALITEDNARKLAGNG